MRILTVCGSLQARSGNRSILEIAGRVAPAGVDVIPFDGLRDQPGPASSIGRSSLVLRPSPIRIAGGWV
jgi:NAD(P)H-dependent FMN reductase